MTSLMTSPARLSLTLSVPEIAQVLNESEPRVVALIAECQLFVRLGLAGEVLVPPESGEALALAIFHLKLRSLSGPLDAPLPDFPFATRRSKGSRRITTTKLLDQLITAVSPDGGKEAAILYLLKDKIQGNPESYPQMLRELVQRLIDDGTMSSDAEAIAFLKKDLADAIRRAIAKQAS